MTTKIFRPVCLTVILVLVLAMVAVALPGSAVRAADTGQQSPTANYGPSSTDWSIPTYAYADDGNTTAGPHGALQIYHNYGFSIPAGSTIDGIEVTLEGAYFSESNPGDPTTAGQIKVEVSWGGGATGTISGTRTQVITDTATTYTIGGATDTWGRTWTVSELSDANFRVRVFAETTPTTTGHFARLDWIPVTVYYTAPALTPSITSVNPNSGHRGLTQDVAITGTNFTGATTVSFGSGITVNSFTVDSDTQITANITIAGILTGNTTLGTRDVSVTTDGGTGTQTAGFTVTAPTEVWVDDNYYDGGSNDGHTWGVDAFDIIQDGIDAVAGSTVNVAPGTYVENITIDNSLTLQSTGGAAATTIDGGGAGDVVRIDVDDATVTVRGFTVTNSGSNEGIETRTDISGTSMDASTINIEDNIFTNIGGDGINFCDMTNGSTVTITGNDISGLGWEGIDTDNVTDSSMTIEDNTIQNNGSYGIKIVGLIDGTLVIRDNDVLGTTGATGEGSGEGILLNYLSGNSVATVDSNTVSGNDDDGIYINQAVGDAEVTVQNNEILDNGDDGIDIEWVDGGPTSATVDIIGNSILGNAGSGVEVNHQNHDYQVTVSSCNDIFDNTGEGVRNISGHMVDATGNWWGDESGPGGEGPGSGDGVT
ncbi:right-handed parallel beta-helix repeat-containing protein, partial [Chloroflexota bacterium]